MTNDTRVPSPTINPIKRAPEGGHRPTGTGPEGGRSELRGQAVGHMYDNTTRRHFMFPPDIDSNGRL